MNEQKEPHNEQNISGRSLRHVQPHTKEIRQYRAQIDQLKSLIKNERIIPKNLTDGQLVEFLYCSRYDVNKARDLARQNYIFKSEMPDIFSRRNPLLPEIQEVWDIVDLTSFPLKTKDGYQIMYSGLKNPNPKLFDFKATERLYYMAIEASQISEELSPAKVTILNAKGVTSNHIQFTDMPHIRRISTFLQTAVPWHIAQVHVLYTSPMIQKFYNFMKPFLQKELVNQLKFHTDDLSAFYSEIPPKLLPQELGGTLESIQTYKDKFRRNVESHKDWFQFEEEQRKNNEVMK